MHREVPERAEAAPNTLAPAPEGDHLRPGQGCRRDARPRCELRSYRPRASPVSRTPRARPTALHPLPRCSRGSRHPPWSDDDDPCVHGRPAARRHAAQGPSPGTGCGGEHRPDLDRRRQGDRARHPGARGQLQGFAARIPVLTGSLVDLTVEVERATSVEEVNACSPRRPTGSSDGHPSYSEEPLVSSDVIKSPFSSRLRLRPDDRHGWDSGVGDRLVRQRMGLLDAARRARSAGARARCARRLTRR